MFIRAMKNSTFLEDGGKARGNDRSFGVPKGYGSDQLHGSDRLAIIDPIPNLPVPKTRRIVFMNNQPASLPGWALLGIR